MVKKKTFRILAIIICILLMEFGLISKPNNAAAVNLVLVEVGSFSIEGDVLIPGSNTTVSLEVKNVSKATNADNVILTISSNSGYIFPAFGTGNQYYIGHLAGGEARTVEIPISVSHSLEGEVADLVCNFSYLYEDTRVSNTEVIAIPATYITPVSIEVVDYSLDSEVLVPGKDTTLSLSVHNISTTKTADAVVMTLSSSSGKVFPAYGSDNQYYIGNIGSDETKNLEIPLSVSNAFDAAGVELLCEFSYISGVGKGSNSVRIALPATGGAPIMAKAIEIASVAILNSKTLLSVTLWNNSSEGISDAKLLISGNVSDDSKEIKLDTLTPMQNYSEDCQITFTESGEQIIEIKLQYTDINGQLRETDLGTYYVNVNLQAEEYYGNVVKSSLNKIGVCITGMALIAVLVSFAYYVRKKL